ncbi:hypothetical protein WJX74_007779 [Apatococcus lobatus]|uniref:Ubiquitin-like domain-containing protein n=1 Tax=Apatococcus lobatus TaxID=904363 RepID=A0AAW1R3K8_9CHLO
MIHLTSARCRVGCLGKHWISACKVSAAESRCGKAAWLLSTAQTRLRREARLVGGKQQPNMAAYGGSVATSGNQIFVTLRRGREWPPKVCDVRAKYEDTILKIKQLVETRMGVPVDKQLLFWHDKELTAAYDTKTLLDLHLHTGFSLKGYDMREPADFWPPVKQTAEAGFRQAT